MRKIFGLYESELNHWLGQALARADIVIDVGANDGYFTFGCAAAMKRAGKPVRIVAFEPLSDHVRQLEVARANAGYSEKEVDIIDKPAGRLLASGCTTVSTLAERCVARSVLLKVDVEGAEVDVLEGARGILSPNTMLVVEVHKEEYLASIPRLFTETIGPLDRVNQRALPLLGREHRDSANWWLVSRLD